MEIVLIVIFAFVALYALWYVRSPQFKGKRGEARVRSGLRRRLNRNEYLEFHDLILPVRGETTQIDHIVVSPFGIFVVETKNMRGWIFGNANNASWTQVIYGHKTRFQNPIRQNHKHVKAVQHVLGVRARYVHNVVVFVGSGVPKTEMPAEVAWGVRRLVRYIKFFREVVFTQDEIDRVISILSGDALQHSRTAARNHIRNVKKQVLDRRINIALCPRCSSTMIKRTNSKTGDKFFGCSQFPKCKGTRVLT